VRTLIWSKTFVKSESEKEEDIFLIEIGTHDEVY